MPEEGGIDFLRWLRGQGHQQPVLVASALDSAQTAVEALHHGAGDYVVKGYEVEELRNRARDVLLNKALAKAEEAASVKPSECRNTSNPSSSIRRNTFRNRSADRSSPATCVIISIPRIPSE